MAYQTYQRRVEHKELFKDIDLLHNNLRKGIVEGPCVDCIYVGALDE